MLKESLTEQLIAEEGEVLHAYKDHLGYLTIGVGRLIDPAKGGGISKDESRYLLSNDIDDRIKKLTALLPFFKDLNEARQGALLNMAFQMGTDGLMNFKLTLTSISKGLYDEAASRMLQSKWATQTPARAKRVAEQIRTGEWQ